MLFETSFKLPQLNKIFLITLLIFYFIPLANSHEDLQFLPASDQRTPLKQAFTTTEYQLFLSQLNRQYLWFNNQSLSLVGLSLHRLLSDLGVKGVAPITDFNKKNIIYQDLALTNGFLLLANTSKLLTNQTSPSEYLKSVLFENKIEEAFESITPKYQQFNQLRLAANFYNDLLKFRWPVLNDEFIPRLGQSHTYVKAIRQRLVLLGDLPSKTQTKSRLDVFDSVVVKSLKAFQLRHGLTADGKLGPKTYQALNVTPDERIKQIQVNLWRWFALPKSPPKKFLLVNIPQYQLSIIEAGQQTLEMKVIVGDSANQTPQLVTEINQITLNPTWTPTRKIIKNDIIPEYEEDYLSLKRKNFSFVKGYWHNTEVREIDSPDLNFNKLLQTYRLVQAPGKNNALGAFRFNIPNNQSIYLHDTPVKYLFKLKNRALSHGCVRLENAKILANYLVKNTENKIFNKSLATGKTKKFNLNQPLAVYITYQTAWINEQGILQLAPDIYQLDQKFTRSAI